jgi:5-methylcytosine-specific restriction endonuclease McrA
LENSKTRTIYNNGEWSSARFNSFVKSALRAASRRWPPKYQVLNEAYVDKRTNTKTGRMAKHYRCNACKELYPSSEIQVDHINPLIDPTIGFTTWDDVINNMFCERDNLQVLCKACHKIKTAYEKSLSKERMNDSRE